MRKCIQLEPRCTPYAKWNIACGLKKLNLEEQALRTLEEIPAGRWWNSIVKDDWFIDPQQTPFMDRFQTLANKKLEQQ